jgi:hypothetical protein
MRVSIFLVLAPVPLVLSQESVSVTTTSIREADISIITITSAPSTTSIATAPRFIGYSTEPGIGAC